MAGIKPFKLDEACDARTANRGAQMTVTEVEGYGRQNGHA